MFDALYLSPHFDDAVLSCGAQIWDRTQRGERVAVVTVCAAPPPPPEQLSPFAASLHARWNKLGTFDRAAEDREALARLDATPIYLNFHDCIYRRSPTGEWLYDSEADIFGSVSALEASLIDELAASFEALELKPGAAIFAPRAIGNHVDHQIVRAAGEQWRRARRGFPGGSFRYYADYPYAESAPGGEEVQVSEAGRRQKIHALSAYLSQLSTFWPDEATMTAQVNQWSERSF